MTTASRSTPYAAARTDPAVAGGVGVDEHVLALGEPERAGLEVGDGERRGVQARQARGVARELRGQ